MQLWVHIQWPSLKSVSCLPCTTENGAVSYLWDYRTLTGSRMKLTRRCEGLLRLLCVARWLSTAQIHRHFFRTKTVDAARKRLRKLADAGYLTMTRRDRMSQGLFAIGRQGKRFLEGTGEIEMDLERTPPKQLEHFAGINDLRLAVEDHPDVKYFFACWELPATGWRFPIIPDAIFSIENRTYAVEYDRGEESVSFFLKTKMQAYSRGFSGLPLAALLVITDSDGRMRSLMKAIPVCPLQIWFARIEVIAREGIRSSSFVDAAGRQTCLFGVSSQTLPTTREE
jgi:hypothetical protein